MLNRKLNVLYIAGLGFSGSTLLSFVLNTHPEIVTIGEMGPAPEIPCDNFKCSCGSYLYECSFFLGIKNEMAKEGKYLNLNLLDLRYEFSKINTINRIITGRLKSHKLASFRDALINVLPSYKNRLEAINSHNKSFINASMKISRKKVFVDATKVWYRIKYLNKISDIELKVVHLTKDPRGYCLSARKRINSDLHLSSRSWNTNSLNVLEVLKRINQKNKIHIKYEDFCNDTKTVLEKITHLLDIPKFDLPSNFRDFPHHIIGNKMRFASDKRNKIVLDQKWKKELTKVEIDKIWKISGNLAESLGYSY